MADDQNRAQAAQEENAPQAGEGAAAEVAQAAEAQAADLEAQAAQAEAQGFPPEYVKRLRDEAAKWRRKVRELEGRLREIEESQMSEAERREKRLAEAEQARMEWETRARMAALKAEVTTIAARQGLDPELAWRLLDTEAVEWDEDDPLKPLGVAEALAELLQKWPHLKAARAAAGSPAQVSPARGRQGRLTVEQIQKMTPQEIMDNWDEVMKVLRGAG